MIVFRGDRLATNVENRSDRAGTLMQTIILFIRRAYPNAGFLECIQRSDMLWRASDSFGKAGEKDYSPERDLEALAKCWSGKKAGSKQQARQRTVQSEIRARVAVTQDRTRRIERLDRRVQAEWEAGHKPIKRSDRSARLIQEHENDQVSRIPAPTPYRESARMVEEGLPEVSAVAAVGASPPDAQACIANLFKLRGQRHAGVA